MQFSKVISAFILSTVAVDATKDFSSRTGKGTSDHTISTVLATAHPHETLRTTLKYEDVKHGYGEETYDRTTTIYDHEEETHDKTTPTHAEATKTHYEDTKVTHTASVHSIILNNMSHNSSLATKGSMTHLIISTATHTDMTSASHVLEASTTIVHSEPSFMAAHTTTTTSTSSKMTSKAFVMSTPPGYMIETSAEIMSKPFQTGLEASSISAQKFTLSAPVISNTDMPAPTQPLWSTRLLSASTSAPSAGFATVGSMSVMATSPAVFTGSGGRQSVDHLLVVAAFPVLVYILALV